MKGMIKKRYHFGANEVAPFKPMLFARLSGQGQIFIVLILLFSVSRIWMREYSYLRLRGAAYGSEFLLSLTGEIDLLFSPGYILPGIIHCCA